MPGRSARAIFSIRVSAAATPSMAAISGLSVLGARVRLAKMSAKALAS